MASANDDLPGKDEATPEFGAGIAPGQTAMVVRTHPETGQRHLDNLTWGLLPYRTPDPTRALRPIYARAETVAEIEMFADAFRRRRAIFPADSYQQQRTTGGAAIRHTVARKDHRPMALAAMWESYRWPNGRIERTFCVITVEANKLLASIHHRMPVILEEPDWPLWLGEVGGDPATVLRPAAEDVLTVQTPRRQSG